MKTLLSSFLFYSGMAYAADDITCEKDVKKDHVVHCKTKKVMNVSLVRINGGECSAPTFHWYGEGKFAIPGTKECFYVGSVTLLIDGHTKIFAPL